MLDARSSSRRERPGHAGPLAAFRAGPALVALLALAGCAATGAPEAAPPLTFAVLPGPSVGAVASAASAGTDAGAAPPTAEDLLLEAVTALSAEREVAAALVPGPLLDGDRAAGADPAAGIAALGGALGSLSAPAAVALAPADAASPALLEGLERDVGGHPGTAAYRLKKGPAGVRVLALGPDGEAPAADPRAPAADPQAEGPGPRTVVVHAAPGDPPGAAGAALVVTIGEAVSLVAAGGRAVLTLPPLVRPPHLWAVVTLDGDEVRVALRSAGGGPAPAPPPPVRLAPR